MKKFRCIYLLLSISFACFTPLTADAIMISEGTVEIFGTYFFDFDTDSLIYNDDSDITWAQISDDDRRLEARNGAQIYGLGTVDYDSIQEIDLLGYTYGTEAIVGPPDGSLLDVGGVFAVRTNGGNYAIAQVLEYSMGGYPGYIEREYYDMHIAYRVYDGNAAPVPEPATILLLGTGLVGLIGFGRKKIIK